MQFKDYDDLPGEVFVCSCNIQVTVSCIKNSIPSHFWEVEKNMKNPPGEWGVLWTDHHHLICLSEERLDEEARKIVDIHLNRGSHNLSCNLMMLSADWLVHTDQGFLCRISQFHFLESINPEICFEKFQYKSYFISKYLNKYQESIDQQGWAG